MLVTELEKIAAQAAKEAVDLIDETQKRKVILFSFFADTVKYVRDFLLVEVNRNRRLAGYERRIAAVTGGDDLEEFSRQAALYGFAPVSTEAAAGHDTDLYDILISTDVLAEGVNLGSAARTYRSDREPSSSRLFAHDLPGREAGSAVEPGAAHFGKDRARRGFDRRRVTGCWGGPRAPSVYRDTRRDRAPATGRRDTL
jgi:hypothetical protein